MMQEDEAQLKTIGAVLCDARESANMSVSRFSQLSGVSEKIVQTLEADHISEFPSEPYVLGVFRKYAMYSAVSYAELVSMWKNMKVSKASGNADTLPHNRFGRPSTLLWRITDIHPIAIIACIVFCYIAFQAGYLALPSRIHIETALVSVTENPIVIQGTVSGYVRQLRINGDAVSLQGNRFSYAVSLQPGPNTVEFESLNFFRQSTKVEKIFVYQPVRPAIRPVPSYMPGGTPAQEPFLSPSASSTGVVY